MKVKGAGVTKHPSGSQRHLWPVPSPPSGESWASPEASLSHNDQKLPASESLPAMPQTQSRDLQTFIEKSLRTLAGSVACLGSVKQIQDSVWRWVGVLKSRTLPHLQPHQWAQ